MGLRTATRFLPHAKQSYDSYAVFYRKSGEIDIML